MSDTNLSTAVGQCIDEICFDATHAIDDDLRWIKADSLGTVRQLKLEQDRRLDALYSGCPASPEYLAAQLEELYAADASSINEDSGNGEGHQVIEQMSDVTVKIFKKEMKQRIHEWEGGFRRRYGREATPHDKAAIRNIYELYKAVKNRALRSADAAPGAASQPAQASTGARPSGGSTTGAASYQPAQGFAANSNSRSSQQPAQQPSNVVTVGQEARSGPATTAVPRTSANPSTTTTAAASSSSTPSTTSNNTNNNQYLFPGLDLRDIAAVTAAKRQLKRLLHAFEDDFRDRNGRVPTREERRPMQREYLRYGELKAVLATTDD